MSKPRFGPDREAALSLNGLPVELAEPEPKFTAAVDWDSIIRNANLTRLEARLFRHHWRRGVPVYKLHIALKCTKAEAQRAYRTVVQKVRIAGHEGITLQPIKDSLHPAYRERLRSGARPWALGAWGAEYAAIMGHEKKYIRLIPQQDAKDFGKSTRVCPRVIGAKMANVESIDLAGQLAVARNQWSTLNTKHTELRFELNQLQSDWYHHTKHKDAPTRDAAKTAALEAAVACILEDREPDAGIMLSSDSWEIRIKATMRKIELIRPALMAAAQRSRDLEAQIQAETDRRLIETVKPKMAEMLRAVDELVERYRREILGPLAEASASVHVPALFPSDIPADHCLGWFNAFAGLVRAQDLEMMTGPRALTLRARRGLNQNGTKKAAA